MIIPNINEAHCGLPLPPPKLEHKSPIMNKKENRKQNKLPTVVIKTLKRDARISA